MKNQREHHFENNTRIRSFYCSLLNHGFYYLLFSRGNNKKKRDHGIIEKYTNERAVHFLRSVVCY